MSDCSNSPTHEYLTINEAVERGFGSRSTICRAIKAGTLPTKSGTSSKGRKMHLIALDDLERMDVRAYRRTQDGIDRSSYAALVASVAAKAPKLSCNQADVIIGLLRSCHEGHVK